jgi:hypothetical protein
MATKKNQTKIGDAECIRICGPYPDKTSDSKWTLHVWLPKAAKAVIVPTFCAQRRMGEA